MLIERIFNRLSCLAAFALLLSPAAIAVGSEEKDKTPAVKKEPAAKEEIAKPEKKDRYEMPEGGVAELVAFIEELEKFRPTNTREYFEYRQKAPAALESAANKILELEKDKESGAHKRASVILIRLSAQRIGQVDTEQQQSIVNQLTDYLSSKELAREDLSLAMNAARALERSGARKMAADAYEAFGKIIAESSDAQTASYGGVFAGPARRLNLIGNTLELQGTKLDGTKFDVTELKGKVVLVDFWATWCGPCVAEFPNIKKYYDKYRAEGFEVVGVSIDRDREKLEKYVEEKQVPWITLHEKDTKGRNPATERYGIFGIPTMFLVGRDGNVISIRARGEELDRLLVEQFGDVEASEDADSDSQASEDAET